jgi:hypothetical protein
LIARTLTYGGTVTGPVHGPANSEDAEMQVRLLKMLE